MWFSSIYLKTLRDYRLAVASWGLGLGAMVAVSMVIAQSQFSSPEARASITGLAESFAWLSQPVDVTSPGGFVTWRLGPFLALLPAIWALLAGSRTLRGEEERGSLDVLLSTPRSRLRTATEKVLALFSALLFMGLLIALPTLAAGRAVQAGFGAGDALLAGVNIALHASVYGALALLLSQFTRERAPAAAAAGALLALAFVLDAVGRMIGEAAVVRWLTPVHYYGLSKPLITGYGADVGGLLALSLLATALSVASIALLLRRDIGAPVVLLRERRRSAVSAEQQAALMTAAVLLPTNDWSLRSVYARSLATVGRQALWWTLVIVAYSAMMTAIARQIKEDLQALLKSSALYSQLVGGVSGVGDLTNDASYLSIVAFALLPLMIGFAVVQAGRWARDEEDGRLEMVLATPHGRASVMLAGFAALVTAVLVIVFTAFVALALAVTLAGLTIAFPLLLGAMLALAPLALIVSATGYLASGWLRTAAVTGLLTLLVVASFFLSFLGAALRWPDSVLQFSLIEQYGTPLVTGVDGLAMLRLVLITAVVLGAAAWRFARKNIVS